MDPAFGGVFCAYHPATAGRNERSLIANRAGTISGSLCFIVDDQEFHRAVTPNLGATDFSDEGHFHEVRIVVASGRAHSSSDRDLPHVPLIGNMA